MSNKPILFFSNDCIYSKQFLTYLSKYNFIDIETVSIDPNPSTKKRPKLFYDIQNFLQYQITKVPTVVLLNDDKYAISGDEAFKWLKFTINKHLNSLPKKIPVSHYNPNEMSKFSDSYSKFGSTTIDDTSEQSFHFITKSHDPISTPREEEFSNIDLEQKKLELESNINIPRPTSTPQFTDTTDHRNINIPHINPNKNIDFSNPNLFNSSNNSHKSKEIDDRLDSLLAERERESTNKPSRTPNRIDWSTGQLIN